MLHLLTEPGLVPVLDLLVLYVYDIVVGHKVVVDFVADVLSDIRDMFMLTGKLLPTVPPPLGVLLFLVPVEHLAQVLQVLGFLHFAIVGLVVRCRYRVLDAEVQADTS